MNEGLAGENTAPPAGARESGAPLVPRASIGGRALASVVAIMTFLASLAAGFAVLIAEAGGQWRETLSREATAQVLPVAGRDMEADLKAVLGVLTTTPGVADVRALDKSESEALLEPWIGKGAGLDALPVPRLIIVRFAPGARPDMIALTTRMAQAAPNAILDDHRVWSQRLAVMTGALSALALAILALLVAALTLAVSFATRSAMAGNRDIIEVLHFIGASDGFIAGQFQRRFVALGLRGALIGAGAASLAFFVAGVLARKFVATPSGEQLEALFGAFAIGWMGYLAIAAICALSAFIAGQTSRIVVFRDLRRVA